MSLSLYYSFPVYPKKNKNKYRTIIQFLYIFIILSNRLSRTTAHYNRTLTILLIIQKKKNINPTNHKEEITNEINAYLGETRQTKIDIITFHVSSLSRRHCRSSSCHHRRHPWQTSLGCPVRNKSLCFWPAPRTSSIPSIPL